MTLISVILAWRLTRGLGADAFLDQLVIVEHWFYDLSWWLWAFVIGMLVALWFILRGSDFGGWFGCLSIVVAVVLLLLPLTSWLTWQFAAGMAANYGPTGILSHEFWLNAALLLLVSLSGG